MEEAGIVFLRVFGGSVFRGFSIMVLGWNVDRRRLRFRIVGFGRFVCVIRFRGYREFVRFWTLGDVDFFSREFFFLGNRE